MSLNSDILSDLKRHIASSVYNNVIHNLQSRPRWILASDIFELLSICSSSATTILIFFNATIDEDWLNMTAGGIGAFGVCCQVLSKYAFKEGKEREDRINKSLRYLNVNEVDYGLGDSTV